MSDSTQTPNPVIYRETVWPSVIAVAPILLLAPATALVVTPFTDFVIATLVGSFAFVVCLFIVLALAPKIVVTSNAGRLNLHAKAASIDAEFIERVEIIEKGQVSAERGPLLDARSYRVFQTSVHQMVKVHLKDKNDTTPYWLVSTRKPMELKKALQK